MQHVLDLAIRYAADRKQFGKSLSQFQVIASYLALMAGELAATSTMLESCLAEQDRAGELDGAMVAAAKIQAGKAASGIASLSHQIHGAMGESLDLPYTLFYRLLRHTRIGGGTDEIQRMLIEPAARKQAPGVLIDAKFSVQFCTALALVRGRVDLDSFTPAAPNIVSNPKAMIR